VAVKVWWS